MPLPISDPSPFAMVRWRALQCSAVHLRTSGSNARIWTVLECSPCVGAANEWSADNRSHPLAASRGHRSLPCPALLLCSQVGDSGVGKTSILLRFTSGDFKSDVRNTVGVDLKVKMLTFRGTKLKLTIWDTGQRNNSTRTHTK